MDTETTNLEWEALFTESPITDFELRLARALYDAEQRIEELEIRLYHAEQYIPLSRFASYSMDYRAALGKSAEK